MRRYITLLLLLLFTLPCLSQERQFEPDGVYSYEKHDNWLSHTRWMPEGRFAFNHSPSWGRDGAWSRVTPKWGRGVEPWTLTDLDYIVDWWRIEEGVTKDGSDKVSSWVGSINGIDLAQAAGGSQPTWTADQINGYPAIVFDGIADFLRGLFGATYSQPNTIIIVTSEPTATAAERRIIDGYAHPLRNLIEWDNTGSIYQLYAGNFVATTYTLGTGFKVLSTVFNGASSVFRVNGIDYSPVGDIGAATPSGLTLGSSAAGGSRWADISVTDVIFVNAAVGTGDLQRVERYLNEHRGGVY